MKYLASKNLSIFVAAAFFPLLLGSSAARTPSPHLPPSSWSPFLNQLNQEPKGDSLTSPFSHEITVDLAALQATENQQILDSVSKEFGPTKGKSRNEKAKLNEAIHQKFGILNQQTTAGIERSAQSHQKSNKDYRKIAQLVLQQVHQNPVANLSTTVTYDTNGQIGFCFGRALLVHHLLLQNAVPQADIAKIFVFGDLMVQRQMWKFHVAVMIRDSSDGYLVVDPLMNEAMSYKSWMDVTKNFEIKGKWSRARYFVTDPRKFLPSFGIYHLDQLEEPLLKPYFDALAVSLKK